MRKRDSLHGDSTFEARVFLRVGMSAAHLLYTRDTSIEFTRIAETVSDKYTHTPTHPTRVLKLDSCGARVVVAGEELPLHRLTWTAQGCAI